MIDLSKYNPGALISLDNGVYFFPAESATGKTYLYNILQVLSSVEPVRGITYNTRDFLSQVLSDKTKKLVMVDRYDLYPDMCHEEIEEFGKHGIVLLDAKHGVDDLRCSPCIIQMFDGFVKVM